MSKSVAVKKHFTFVGGLNTEAGPLTFPANSWAEGDNVIPGVDGAVGLRHGLDYEPSYSLSTSTHTDTQEANGAFVVGEWNNVGGDGNLHFAVVQRDTTLSFYINSGETISTQAKSFTIDLSAYKAATSPETSGVAPIACSNANGRLIIVSRDTEPLLVTYTASSDTISVSAITVQIRDFIGLDDGLAVNAGPGTLSNEHNYNLRNQGWDATKISAYFTAHGSYPQNAQSWTAGKNSSDDFDPALLVKQDFGTSPAPKGRYVLNVFSRDRATASGIGGLSTETESYRPTTVAFFAGRAWYAGVKSSTIGTWVMFSQVAETTTNLGRCYQDADPTSEVISDLVASDGGVIPIQDAGNVVKLLPFGNVMLVICDNGVWQVVGGLDTGFSADAYEVRRLSTNGCVSAKSVVLTDGAVVYWGEDDIYAISPSQTGGLTVTSLTAETIQTLYNDIPMTGKAYSSGVYVQEEHVIYWGYNDSEVQDGITRRFKKNRILCLDVSMKCFYTMTIEELASSSPYFTDLFVTKSKAAASTVYNVVDGSSNTVIDDAGTPDQVIATQNPGVNNAKLLKFLVIHPVNAASFKVTMGEFDETNDAPRKFKDWYSKDSAGVFFDGYVIPGYDFGADQGADKYIQALYVLCYFRRTETGIDADGNAINPSSCTMRGRWDWSDTASGNRWSQAQEVYRHRRPFNVAAPSAEFDDGEPVVVTKNKVRGRGRALQLHFAASGEGDDMQMLGWAITYVGNANV
jgi:hypothetical protein